jgi:hypothetical protein
LFTEGNISKPKMKGEIDLRNLLTGNKFIELRNFCTNAYRTKQTAKAAKENRKKIGRRGRTRCMWGVQTTKQERKKEKINKNS